MHVDVVKILLDARMTRVSAQDPDGWTVLHFATWNNDIRAIEALKEAGADFSVRNNDGQTPMHLAAKNGHVDAIKALKEAGADVSAQDKDGRTPMH